jgi:hypothetical protein
MAEGDVLGSNVLRVTGRSSANMVPVHLRAQRPLTGPVHWPASLALFGQTIETSSSLLHVARLDQRVPYSLLHRSWSRHRKSGR